MSVFLVLRYVAFAFFISFSSVICVVASFNLGSLPPDTPRLPEVDSYLIFLGALGLVVVFPVLFVELFRKNALISRVLVEVTWVALLWVMHLSGAAAISAIVPDLKCTSNGPMKPIECASAMVLLAFTWLSTLTLLSYLLGLLVCAVHHHLQNGKVWRSGVRDYPWFSPREPETPVNISSYGKLRDFHDPPPAAAVGYARQLGLTASYGVEPLPSVAARIVPPVPAAAPPPRLSSKYGSQSRRAAQPTPLIAAPSPSSNTLSLYPQHLQATVGKLPAFPGKASGSSPPPAGSWPRSRPQEPLPRKQRSLPPTAPAAAPAAEEPPDMAQREGQLTTTPGAGRPKPVGARTPPSRVRPPPLDLSRLPSFEETHR